MAGSKEGSHSSIEKERTEHVDDMPKHKEPKTPMERQIALKAALEVDPGVTRFSLRAFQVSKTDCLPTPQPNTP